MNSKYIFQTLSVLLLFQCLGCSNFVEVDPPKTKLPVSEAFKSNESATATITGIYAMMRTNSVGLGSVTIYPGISSDELIKFSTTAEVSQFANNQLFSNNSIVGSFWTDIYKMIGQANSCIEGLSSSTSLSPGVKSQLLGEAKISRALLYFYLVNLYGDVPLVLTTNWIQTQSLSRSPAAQVYTQIINDLKEAASETSETYPTSDKVRPNKFAALALLARVYLYTRDYKNAEDAASQVIESGIYALPDIDEAFLASNTEAIWQLQPIEGLKNDTEEAQLFIPRARRGAPAPSYYLTDYLLQAFEPGDKRRSHWISSIIYQGKTYEHPYKYKILDNTNSNGLRENYTLLRLAETYLIRAEARAQNGDMPGAVADLNIIRDRAREVPTSEIPDPLPALPLSLTKEAVMAAVENERRTELCFEWGHRWFDLKRTGRSDAVLQSEKPTWTPSAKLYPIPQAERLLNKNVSQNEGYN